MQKIAVTLLYTAGIITMILSVAVGYGLGISKIPEMSTRGEIIYKEVFNGALFFTALLVTLVLGLLLIALGVIIEKQTDFYATQNSSYGKIIRTLERMEEKQEDSVKAQLAIWELLEDVNIKCEKKDGE